MVFHSLKRKEGQGAVDYLILIALLVLMALAIISLTGVNIRGIFINITGAALSASNKIGTTPPGSSDARMPTGTKTGKTERIFFDDFSNDDLPGWIPLHEGMWKGHWDTGNGKAVGEPFSAMIVKDFIEDNYIITANNIQLTDMKKNYDGFGIIFRANYNEMGSGYMFEIEKKDPEDPGLIYFSKWVMGYQVFPPISSAPLPAGMKWNSPCDVKVHVMDDTFTAFINGEQVLIGKDDLYRKGTAGLSVNNGSIAAIDDFRIEHIK